MPADLKDQLAFLFAHKENALLRFYKYNKYTNRGQHPRLNKFYLITTLLDISVDQFFFPCNEDGDNNRCKQVDVLLNDMEEKELIVMEATAQGLKKARETAE